MNTTTTKLIAILTLTLGMFATTAAMAGHPKTPNQNSSPHRPQPVSVSTLKGAKLNSTVLSDSKLTSVTGSGFTITHGGHPPGNYGNDKSCKHEPCKHEPCHEPCHYNWCGSNYGCVRMCRVDTCEPSAFPYLVRPGDTIFTISMKQYGTMDMSGYIATYNNLSENFVLVPGQTLMLPSLGANRVMTTYHGPVATSMYPFVTR